MRPLGWKGTAELIGLLAILASLIFVAMQLQQQEELLSLELESTMISTRVAVNEKIIENPDIWIRGNSGEDLSAAELVIYKSLLVNLNDWYFHTDGIFQELEPESEEIMLTEFAGFLARNPGAHRVWIDRERRLNADRTAVDPNVAISVDWIEPIEARIALIKSRPPTRAPQPE